jgi:hypothetical protein
LTGVQRDYILPITQELGAVLVRLQEQFGLGQKPPEEVAQGAQTAQVARIGPHVDTHSGVWLVRGVRKAKLWTKFMRLEAPGCRAQGKEKRAVELEARAEALEQVAEEFRRVGAGHR